MLPRQSGLKQVFAGMLAALAETLEDLTGAHLRPVGLAISEFLIGAVPGDVASNLVRATSSVRIALFRRICQTIEAEFGEPELSLTKVAKQQGISPRDMQKLSELGDQSFGHSVRSRRLERCRADLGSPLQRRICRSPRSASAGASTTPRITAVPFASSRHHAAGPAVGSFLRRHS